MLFAVLVDQTTAFISGFFVNDAKISNALERHLTLVLIMRHRSRTIQKTRARATARSPCFFHFASRGQYDIFCRK